MLDKILVNLRILNKLQPNQKLSVDYDHSLRVESDGWSTALLRTVTRNSRTTMLVYLNQLVLLSIEYSNGLMQTKLLERQNDTTSSYLAAQDLKSKNDLDNLFSAMRGALDGFEQLKTTYEEDAQVVAQLDVVKNKLNDQVILVDSFKMRKS